MKLRICLGLSSAMLVSSLFAACGGDDAPPPPPDVDAGADAALDSGSDAAATDSGSDAGLACATIDVDGDGESSCTDCDDNDSSRRYGATEICDGDDEDCDDTTFGPDMDGDGFVPIACCNGVGNCGTDCDDSHASVNPSVIEVCNGGIDDDCNGLADIADGVCVPCGTGYTGFDGECTNIDECATNPCGTTSTSCLDTVGSYTCTCVAGYAAGGIGGGGTCADIDECALGACGGGASGCVNAVGSYACSCNAGYTAPATGGTCTDVNECALGTDACTDAPVPAGCSNTTGSYVCTCPTGYGGTGRGVGGCVDVNECTAGTHDCDTSPLAICANTVGSFTCACPSGWSNPSAGHGASGCATTRFTDLLDGTVRDNASGAVWQQAVDVSDYSQAEAIAYCAGLALDGGGWRLPTIDELMSIVDTRFDPTIDPTYFPGTPRERFHSSSPDAGSPSNGWRINFMNGVAYTTVGGYPGRARCVR
jgi:hypothetical protein